MAAITNPVTLAEIWRKERKRWLFQVRNYARYRFTFPRSNTINFMHDVFLCGYDPEDTPDHVIDCIPESTDWFERYFNGYHTSLGYPVFTDPQAHRQVVLDRYAASSGIMSPISIQPHNGDAIEALAHASEHGYNRFANALFFRARLRGDYLSCSYFQNGAVVTVLTFHILGDEPIIRTRRICAYFDRMPSESKDALKARVAHGNCDRSVLTDGWALTGTNQGIVFGFERDQRFDDFGWNSLDTRLFEFGLVNPDGFNRQHFRLVRSEHDLNKLEGIFRHISQLYDLPDVA